MKDIHLRIHVVWILEVIANELIYSHTCIYPLYVLFQIFFLPQIRCYYATLWRYEWTGRVLNVSKHSQPHDMCWCGYGALIEGNYGTDECTRCDNLIPQTDPLKKNFLTCALVASHAFQYSPCEPKHFIRRRCHCRKQSWRSFSWIRHSNVTLHWLPGTSANLCPFKTFLNLERGKNVRSWVRRIRCMGPFL
jgi:hypothetical protein